MIKNALNVEVEAPKDISKLVEMPYDKGVFLCPLSKTRWLRLSDGEYARDLTGEKEWAQMAEYVDKTYAQVFMEAYDRAKKA